MGNHLELVPDAAAAIEIPNVQVMQVVRVEYRRGLGTAESPLRQSVAFYSVDGEPLAMHDVKVPDDAQIGDLA